MKMNSQKVIKLMVSIVGASAARPDGARRAKTEE